MKSPWVNEPRFFHGTGCLSGVDRGSVGVELGIGLCGMS
jgi:hypothetical protein